jgi:hypothetical protein
MDQILIDIIGACTALCALAMLVQIWTWIALARTGLRIKNVIASRMPHIIAAKNEVTALVKENREPVKQITATAKDVVAITKKEVAVLNESRHDTARRYAVERERLELMTNDIKDRASRTAHVFETGIAQPWRDVMEFLNALRTGYDVAASEVATTLPDFEEEEPEPVVHHAPHREHRPAA